VLRRAQHDATDNSTSRSLVPPSTSFALRQAQRDSKLKASP